MRQGAEGTAGTILQEATESRSVADVAAELDRNYKTYTHYNSQRAYIMRRLTPEKRSLLLQSIPFLFHVNDRRLPGYVAELGENIGVHGFKSTDEVRAVRKEYFAKHQGVGVGLSRVAMIESIASIGSAGTLAQTDHSDFDLWIVCRSDISRGDYNLIGKKADAIKAWLLSMDPALDLNFYLATPADVRRHHFGAVSDDSAGSALGTFLKEEFYRTLVVWTGKIPFWWILSPSVRRAEEYEELLATATEGGFEFMREVMDMGPLVRSTPEKFLSAVLWQTNKSLKSPFKSLLKLTVVSRYGDEADGNFLAEVVRKRVLEDTTFGAGTDPYLCLFEFCAQYWRGRKDEEGVRLMAEMFFMKMLGAHGNTGAADADVNDVVGQRRRLARNMLRDWGLSHTDMQDLANKDKWGFERGLEYNDKTQQFVMRIFERVMGKLADLGIKFIDGKVVTLRDDVDPIVIRMLSEFSNISHKVDCFYGKSLKKVQPIPPAMREMLSQTSYTLSYQAAKPKWERWTLTEDIPEYVAKKQAEAWGKVIDKSLALDASESKAAQAETDKAVASDPEGGQEGTKSRAKRGQVLQQNASILTLISWLCANRMIQQGSGLNVILDGEKKPVSEVRRVITRLVNFFRHPLYQDSLPESTFKQPPQPFRVFVSFDFLQHTHLLGRKGSGGEGTAQISSRAAVTSVSKVDNLTIAEQDTYGVVRVHEVPVVRFSAARLMGRILRQLEGVPHEQLEDRIQFHAADTPFHQEYAKEFEGALRRAHQELAALPRRKNFGVRYVTKVGGHYLALTRIGDEPLRATECNDFVALMAALEKSTGAPTQTIVDPVVEGPERLRSMFSRWVPGRIQVFVHRGQKTGSIHVIDEIGCFHNERLPIHELEPQLAAMLLFMSKLSSASLKHALRVDGKIQFKVWEVSDSISSDVGYHYSVNQYVPRTPQLTQLLTTTTVFIKFIGSLNFADPHRLELIVGANSKTMDVAPVGFTSTVATLLAQLLRKAPQLKDFSVIGLEKVADAGPPSHLVEYLVLRRALDRAFRRAIKELGSEA